MIFCESSMTLPSQGDLGKKKPAHTDRNFMAVREAVTDPVSNGIRPDNSKEHQERHPAQTPI